jgi:hypothetical protein
MSVGREVSGRLPHTRLRDLLTEGVGLLGEGILRHGAERDVPLGLWRCPAFTAWYDALRASDHVIRTFQLRYVLLPRQTPSYLAGTRFPD